MALRKSKKENKQTSQAAEKTGQVNFLVMFVMMLAVFLVGAGMVIGYFKFFTPDGNKAEAKEKTQKEVPMSAMELGDMVVNLAGGPTDDHFLKTRITIEYPEDKKLEELVQEKKHHIIETVLITLRQKTIEDVRPPRATDQLKKELVKNINDRLGKEVIERVIFTQYIVQ